jgi:hypothetical protein
MQKLPDSEMDVPHSNDDVLSRAVHAKLRASSAHWNALPLVGYQHCCDPDIVVELRNCACGSTLGRRTRKGA